MRIIRENIYDMNETFNILYSNELLNTNIKDLKYKNKFNQQNFIIVENYLEDYNDNLKDIEREYKNRKNIKCIKLEIAYKNSKSKEDFYKITKKVIKYFTGDSYVLPYIGFINDNHNILTLVLFDRYFYPKGKKIEVIAKSDYKDGKFKKGDIIRTELRYMSHKIRIFNFVTKEQLSKYFDLLRTYLYQKTEITEAGTISDKKIKISKGKYFKTARKELDYSEMSEYRMRKIRAYNMLIRAKNMKRITIDQSIIDKLKKRIYTFSSVYDFEEDIMYIFAIN